MVRRSPSPNCPSTGWAVGVRHPHAVGAGVWVWGPNTVPFACPVGAACQGGGGGPSPGVLGCHRCEGRLVSGAVPLPAARPLGRAAGVLRPVCPGCGRCGPWGPRTSPTACALAGQRCSQWGWPKGVPGGDAFHSCEGRLWSGAPPPRTARPLGALLGSATHMLWPRACGCGGPTLSPWPACPVGAACRGGGGGPSPGGVACHHCEGRLVSGAVPPPGPSFFFRCEILIFSTYPIF